MSGAFSGLNTSLSGLFAASRKLDVINHNVGNANTPGYSRQEAVQKAAKAYPAFDGSGLVGKGSYIETIDRIRNEYMDTRFWSQNQVNGEASVKEKMLMDIEGILGEPSESGITTVMQEFFNSLHDLNKEPDSASARSAVMQNAITFTRYFNNISENLDKFQAEINQNISSTVKEINALGSQIVKVNKQIFDFEISGHTANDLRDKRTLLIDQLSGLIDTEVQEINRGVLPDGSDDMRTVIRVGGNVFIDDTEIEELELIARDEKLNKEDIQDLYKVQWNNGDEVEVKSGELNGYLMVRDGNSGLSQSPNFKGIPFYQSKLDDFVRTFAKAFNEGTENTTGHAFGYGISNDESDPPTGIRFFTTSNEDGEGIETEKFLDGAQSEEEINDRYDYLTAKHFSVSKEILDGYFNIATSIDPELAGNSDIIKGLIDLRHDKGLFEEGAPEDFYRNVVTTLAVDLQQASRLRVNSSNILTLTENRRIAESGVSIDEEMANMIRQQQVYSASASLINTWNEIYDILLNRTGL